jgi:alpha-1,2-mannosyltransferase
MFAERTGWPQTPDGGSEEYVVVETDAARRSRLLRRVAIVAAVAVATLTFDYFLAVRHGFFDLDVYFGAVNYWVHDGGSIYDYLKPFSTYGFTYPPFAALVMLPMAIAPWTLAIIVSCLACATVSVMLIYWYVDPVARREGWTRWYAVGLVTAFAIAFEPLRETFLFGQVNMYLVAVVGFDLLFLVSRNSRFAGVGVGLATAVKLTPGVFILYLLVTKRWRAAITASATAAGATLIAAALAPDASRVFWTDALWNTDRVGAVAFISNQSLNGAVARIHEAHPSTLLWVATVLAVLAIWAVRVRRAAATNDQMTGFALTGVLGCLISPITWVHHLVWTMPAVLLLLDHAVSATTWRRRRWLWGFLIFTYGLLCSRLVWSFHERWGNPLTWFLSNSYVWISLALLIALPLRETQPSDRSRPQRQEEVATGDFDEAMEGLMTTESVAPSK